MNMYRLRAAFPITLTSIWVLAAAAAAHEGEHSAGELMMIAGVAPDSPAAKAGLETGDRVLTWEGQKITTQQELNAFLDSFEPGDQIALTVERDGKTLELPLIFSERADGGVSIGVSIGVAGESASEGDTEGFSAAECLAWVDSTYRLASMAADLDLDLSIGVDEIRACMDRDTQLMAKPIPRTWCDNVFKVHCSGLDPLAEIGDALVAKCEKDLSASLGIDLAGNKAWTVCGEQKIFDRYSVHGNPSDAATCRQILIEECGAEIED